MRFAIHGPARHKAILRLTPLAASRAVGVQKHEPIVFEFWMETKTVNQPIRERQTLKLFDRLRRVAKHPQFRYGTLLLTMIRVHKKLL